MRLKLHDDAVWIVNHAWSMRFLMVAFLLSAAEVALPYFADKTPIRPDVFAGVIGIVTGAAFIARLVAQRHMPTPDKADEA